MFIRNRRKTTKNCQKSHGMNQIRIKKLSKTVRNVEKYSKYSKYVDMGLYLRKEKIWVGGFFQISVVHQTPFRYTHYCTRWTKALIKSMKVLVLLLEITRKIIINVKKLRKKVLSLVRRACTLFFYKKLVYKKLALSSPKFQETARNLSKYRRNLHVLSL